VLRYRKTWEKVFYCLLCKYRTRNLENFNMEEAEVRKPPRKSVGEYSLVLVHDEYEPLTLLHHAEKRQHVVNTGAIASRSRRSRQSLQNIAAAATTTKRSAPKASGSTSPPPHTRPAPTAPASSSPQHARSSPRAPRPLPTAPGSSTAAGTPSSRVPLIHLQSATPDTVPQSGLQPNALPLPPSTQSSPLANSGGWESAPPSPSPAPQAFDSAPQQPIVTSGYVPPASPAPTFESTAGGAPVLPIHIPQTGDAAMQQFFHDIVGQLQTISLRNSLPPSPMGSPVMGFRGDSYLGGGGGSVGGRDSVMSNGSAARTTPLPEVGGGGAGDQFEDAEEDDESDAGGYEGAASSSIMSGSMRGPTPSYDINTQDPFRITYQPHRSTSPSSPVRPLSTATSPIGPGPPLVRPRIAMRGSSREPSRPSSRNDYGDKENRAAPPPASGSGAGRRVPPPLAPRPTASAAQAGKERATLGLAIQSAGVPSFEYEMIEMPDSPTALKGHGNGYANGGQKRMTMKKKRKFSSSLLSL
jgi:hypothetical protein